jgi:hypothetical protein
LLLNFSEFLFLPLLMEIVGAKLGGILGESAKIENNSAGI